MKREREPLAAAELATVRSALARLPGKRRLDLLIDHPRPEALVRALPADELYFTIREVGLGDAADVVQLASPAQFRTFVDLAAWKGERLEVSALLPWLRAARAGSHDSPLASRRWRAKLAGLDKEVLVLALRETLRVHDLDEDDDPEIEGDRILRTPEGRFIVEFLVDGTGYMAVRGLLDDLFAEDPFTTTRLLSAIRWELPSELEETGLRWRGGRLADLGYPSREEALSWFARPPAGAPPSPAGRPDRPPGFWIERIGQGSLLARAAARLPPDEREGVELELVTAANAVLTADAVDPGDPVEARAAVESARDLVEMGLELASAFDEARAGELLATTSVKSLFQRGFGELLALGWQAERLLASGHAGSRDAPLLDDPLGALLAALARRRPLYFPGLDAPRERWGSPEASAFTPRPFRSSAEVARARAALGQAGQLAELASRLGLAARTLGPGAPRLAGLYLTALAQERLGRPFAPVPLQANELPAAAAVLEPLDDPRLAAQGEAGELLATLARAAAASLAPLRDGSPLPPGAAEVLLVEGAFG